MLQIVGQIDRFLDDGREGREKKGVGELKGVRRKWRADTSQYAVLFILLSLFSVRLAAEDASGREESL